VRRAISIVLTLGLVALEGCQSDLPPLLRGATSVGGQGYECQAQPSPASDRSLARSPELIERLQTQFPPGSASSQLRTSLVRQGFKLEGLCSRSPGGVNWAQYRQNGNEVVANVYWLEGIDGRLVWTFGDVAYTFL
jgi:hypothetical protein